MASYIPQLVPAIPVSPFSTPDFVVLSYMHEILDLFIQAYSHTVRLGVQR